MSDLFGNFQLISTDDIDEARSFISSELTEMCFKEIENASSFAFHMNGVQLDQTLVGYEVFDTTTVVDAGEVEEALVAVIGVGPASIIEIDGEPIDCSKNGVIVSPHRRMVLHRPPNGGTLFIRTTMKTVETLLHQMIARKPTKKLAFDRCFSLENGVGLQLSRIVKHLATDIGQNTEALGNPFLNKGYESLILDSFLSLPNNLSDELIKGQNYSVAPSIVRHAEEFLSANAVLPITIADVVKHCECSRRTLYNAFRCSRAYTPMEFLHETRLCAARKKLLSPSCIDTVSSIALKCGFTHLSRFAEAYGKRFSELPSETLRKTKA
jgi:AraC-like DNA-binding protein